MDYLRVTAARGRYLGLETEFLSAAEAAEMLPLLDPAHYVGAMYEAYREQMIAFETWVMLRKVVLLAVLVSFRSLSVPVQLATLLVVMISYLALLMKMKPYEYFEGQIFRWK